jgi:hypothetical protein
MTHRKRKPATAGDGLSMSSRLGGSQDNNSQQQGLSQQLDRRAHELESLRIAREALGERGCMAFALAALASHYARLATGGAR